MNLEQTQVSDAAVGDAYAPPAGHGAAPSVLVVATTWWPSLARLADLVQQAGCRVAVLCPAGHPVRELAGARIFTHPAFRPLAALSRAISACGATVLVPGDDRSVALLHRLHEIGTPAERCLVEISLGDPAFYHIARSRLGIVEAARRVGLKAPGDDRIDTRSDMRGWIAAHTAPWVFKVDGAWSGLGVRVVRSEAEAERAVRALSGGLSVAVALKRLFINSDAYWLADRMHRRRRPIVSAQEYIVGRPGNLAMFCCQGRILAVSVVEAVACWGETGPSTIVRRVERPEFVAGARKLAGRLGLSGFFGLDFMVDDATDEALLIEMNPRATSLCNIRIAPHGDLIAAAVKAWGGGVVDGVPAPASDMIAHFPLSWHWNPNDPRLAGSYQDIPTDAPALVRAMLAPSWPDRQKPARLWAALGRRFSWRRQTRAVRLTGAARSQQKEFHWERPGDWR